MAYISLKISNVYQNIDELVERLSGIKNKQNFVKKLLLNIKSGNVKMVYLELLFRIEYYSSLKVLNYTKQDLNEIVTKSKKFGLETVVNTLMTKLAAQKTTETVETQITRPENALILLKEYWVKTINQPDPRAFTNFANTIISLVSQLLEDEKFLGMPLTSGIDFADVEEYLFRMLDSYKAIIGVKKNIVSAIEYVLGLSKLPQFEDFLAIYVEA